MTESHVSGNSGQSVIPQDVQRNWNHAAEQVFGSALSRPDIYQRATTVVGKVVAVLRARAAGTDELLYACEAPDELVGRVLAEQKGLSVEGLDVSQLVAAACAMRYREVVDESAAASRKSVLAASSEPRQWVVLAESGPYEGDPFVPYRRLEAQRASGLVLAIGTRPDDEFAGCIHSIDILRIDSGSGKLLDAPANLEIARSFESTSSREREQDVITIKQELHAWNEPKN